jgi:hypothetical protein
VTLHDLPNLQFKGPKRLSLIHAAGTYESRGRLGGLFLGNGDGLFFGRYRGTNQSRLSKIVGPPTKAPFGTPIILWLIGFFLLVALDGRGRLSWLVGMLSVAYVLALPVYLLGALFYNIFLRPRKLEVWEHKFMCQKCGAIIRSQTDSREAVQVRA